MQAGRGLAAAHAAGLVHRDFKPDNVLVGDDGRVRVLDFGLARPVGENADERTVARGLESLERSQTGTETGALCGTPAYLAPEVLAGLGADPRSDQWSFCAALWEAVHGRRPFAGATLLELASRVMSGEREPAPRGAKIPGWLRRAIDRGLQIAPAERHATMDRLVDELAAGLLSRRRPAVATVVGAPSTPSPVDAQDDAVPLPTISLQQAYSCTAADGTRLAFAKLGDGPPIVKVANWLSHLELDWNGDVWKKYLELLARGRRLVRYDARGNGMSDWNPPSITFEGFVSDLATVMDAAAIDRAPLFGISQGAAIATAYAARHPERVSALILVGGCARGWRVEGHPVLAERFQALMVLMRQGWVVATPPFARFRRRHFP